MGRIERPALRGTLLGGLLRLWNPFMKRLLRSPLHRPWSRWFLVIEWTGERSGRTYRTPVSYARVDDELLVTSGDRWAENIDEDPRIKVWVEGRARQATAGIEHDEAASLRLHRELFARHRTFARFAGLGGSPSDEEILRSIRAGRRLVRIRPD
jgi:hypothetical protein